MAKIRFPIARRIGRRLMRAYGSHGGMFELGDKLRVRVGWILCV
jgi:hypothetical protein